MMPRRIILLGRAGVGKTTLARALAARLNCPAVVLDELWRPEWAGAELTRLRPDIPQMRLSAPSQVRGFLARAGAP